MNNLGAAYKALNQFEEAKKVLNQSVAIYGALYGDSSHKLISPYLVLGDISRLEHNCEEKVLLMTKAKNLALKHYKNSDHANILKIEKAMEKCENVLDQLII